MTSDVSQEPSPTTNSDGLHRRPATQAVTGSREGDPRISHTGRRVQDPAPILVTGPLGRRANIMNGPSCEDGVVIFNGRPRRQMQRWRSIRREDSLGL